MKNPVFVSATETFGSYAAPVAAPLFRKLFSVTDEKATATVTLTAVGFYDLFLNGEKITRGYLCPCITNPEHILYSETYDLTGKLKKGENCLCVALGNGLRNNPGGQIWDFDVASFRGAPAFALEASVGGETFTAEDFEWTESPILFDDYRTGVVYDARRELPGVMTGANIGTWKKPIPATGKFGEIRTTDAEPVSVIGVRKPVAVYPGSRVCRQENAEKVYKGKMFMDTDDFADGFLYDFGVNSAGTATLRIRGMAGQHVRIRFGEGRVGNDLSLHTLSYNAIPFLQFFDYTCRGGEVEEITVPFIYYGARYAHVWGITAEQATPELLTFSELSNGFSQRMTFSCSDPSVNAIFDMAVRSDRSNFIHFPNDCPQREKNGWTGDASESSEHMLLLYASEKCFTRWENEITKAQTDAGQLPGIVPTGGWGYAWGNGPAWDRVMVNLPYFIEKYTGDLTAAKTALPHLIRYLRYLETKKSPDGTIAIGLGDWCQVNREASNPTTPLAFTDSVVAMDIAKKTASLAEKLGDAEAKNYAQAFAKTMRETVRKTMFHPEDASFCDGTQTAQAFAIYYGLLEDGEIAAAYARLKTEIEKDGRFMNVGFLGGRVLFHVLGEMGDTDLALEMITRKEGPSYGYLLDHGFTTLAEDFTVPNCKHENWNSHNHHCMADVAHFFVRHVLGMNVNPDGNHPNSVAITPCLASGIFHAEGTRKMPNGFISMSWDKTKNGICLTLKTEGDVTVILPENAREIAENQFVL